MMMWAMSVVKDSRGGNELWGERNLLDLVNWIGKKYLI